MVLNRCWHWLRSGNNFIGGYHMAIKQGDKFFTAFQFIENGGKPFNRQIHRITVQDRTGVTRTVSGKELPNLLVLNTGATHSGQNVAEILLSPERIKRRYSPFESKPWPCGRDVLNFAIGFFAILMLRFFASAFGLN